MGLRGEDIAYKSFKMPIPLWKKEDEKLFQTEEDQRGKIAKCNTNATRVLGLESVPKGRICTFVFSLYKMLLGQLEKSERVCGLECSIASMLFS